MPTERGNNFLYSTANLKKINATSPFSVITDVDSNINISIDLTAYYTIIQLDAFLATKQPNLSNNSETDYKIYNNNKIRNLIPINYVNLSYNVDDNFEIGIHIIHDFYNKTEVNNLLNNEQDTITNNTAGTGQEILYELTKLKKRLIRHHRFLLSQT